MNAKEDWVPKGLHKLFTVRLYAAAQPWQHLPTLHGANSQPTSSKARLAVSLEAEAVVPLPGGASAGAQLVGGMPLVSQTSVLLAGAGEPTQLTVLVDWVCNPVDACILQGQCHCKSTETPTGTHESQV